MGWYEYKPYVPVAQRRAQAAREVAKRLKKGQTVLPVQVEGRTIASTFWGQAWCTNLEGYSDYANRLPRGRTYVRNGSVIDLKIENLHCKRIAGFGSLDVKRSGQRIVALSHADGVPRLTQRVAKAVERVGVENFPRLQPRHRLRRGEKILHVVDGGGVVNDILG